MSSDLFARPPAFDEQDRHQAAVRIEPEIAARLAEGVTLTIEPSIGFATPAPANPVVDLREAKLDTSYSDWRLTVGVDQVFWGVTETAQITDIVNQSDRAIDPFGDEKLGQPMVRVSRFTELGLFEGYYFPVARGRTFPGADGRLRLQPYVDQDAELWDTGAEALQPSFAVRWENTIGRLDMGAFAFHGVAREPAFVPAGNTLRPFYALVQQIGIDAQWTQDATLLKLETVGVRDWLDRRLRRSDGVALAAGIEQTFFGAGGGQEDVAAIMEYSFDSRRDDALTALQNDLTGGFRWTLNDTAGTQLRGLATWDLDFGSLLLQARAETRLSDTLLASLEGIWFADVARRDLLNDFREDSFVRLELEYFY